MTVHAVGAFSAPDRRAVFDLNDFDETLPAPSSAWRRAFANHPRGMTSAGPKHGAILRMDEMPRSTLLEDYGLIGDLQSAALVGRDGSIDWLCLPRFDSASCFSALLGDERHGRWLLAPAGEVRASLAPLPARDAGARDRVRDRGRRRARDRLHAAAGRGPAAPDADRRGLRGRVPMRMELAVRPDYGTIVPWVELAPDGGSPPPGPDGFRLSTPLPLRVEDGTVAAEFTAIEGARERLTLTWHLSYEQTPPVEDADSALARTEAWWQEWSGRCRYEGACRDEVLTSLIVLKAMTSETTGAVIAAPTTSLPEDIGGVRNWDYRYCWLRDSVLALEALLAAATRTRHWPSATSCCAPPPATRPRSRSCTASAASGA